MRFLYAAEIPQKAAREEVRRDGTGSEPLLFQGHLPFVDDASTKDYRQIKVRAYSNPEEQGTRFCVFASAQ